MRLQRSERLARRHVWYEPQVEFRHCFMGEDRLPAWTSIATNESLDVDRGPRHQQFERLTPTDIVHPMINAKLLLRNRFIETARTFRNHRLLGLREWARLVSETVNGRIVAVLRDERC